MKKFSKGLVFISVGFLLIAVIFLALSAIYFIYIGGSIPFITFEDYVSIALYETQLSIENDSINRLDVKPVIFKRKSSDFKNIDNIRNLKINVNNTNIIIRKGTENKLVISWFDGETPEFKYKIKDNNLTINNSSVNHIATDIKSIMIITLKEDLDSVVIDSNHGSINILDLEAKDLILYSKDTSIKLDQINILDKFRILNSYSKLDFTNSSFTKIALYSSNSSHVNLENLVFRSGYITFTSSIASLENIKSEFIKLASKKSLSKLKNISTLYFESNSSGGLSIDGFNSKEFDIVSSKETNINLNNLYVDNFSVDLKKSTLKVNGKINNIFAELNDSNADFNCYENNFKDIFLDIDKSVFKFGENLFRESSKINSKYAKLGAYYFNIVDSKVKMNNEE